MEKLPLALGLPDGLGLADQLFRGIRAGCASGENRQCFDDEEEQLEQKDYNKAFSVVKSPVNRQLNNVAIW